MHSDIKYISLLVKKFECCDLLSEFVTKASTFHSQKIYVMDF